MPSKRRLSSFKFTQKKKHIRTQQQNAVWQNGSYRKQLAIPSGAQLYFKRFSRGIPIPGTFGQHLVDIILMKHAF
jgi:hypothetical protein